MRRIITCLIALLFFSLQISAQQVPNGFNYQSIARDAMGLPIVNSQIKLRITVRQNNISGTDVWQEIQTATTNQFGLINLVIGNGSKTSVGLASITGINTIDWSSDNFFILVEVDNGGSYAQLGITQFQSVPYALASDNALKIQGTKVGAIIPTANEFLKFNALSGQWEPGNISGANGGTVISIGGIGPITITGNAGLAPQVNILQSSAIQDGYLSSFDWAVFANKLGTTTGFSGNVSGTYDAITVTGIQNIPVTSIAPTYGQILMYDGIQWVPTTTGATSGVTTVIGSGEISVSPGSSPVISILTASGISNGIITVADYISFSNKLTINSIAGGDLSGPYNNLIVNKIGGVPVSLASAPTGSVLSFNGIGFVPAVLTSTVNITSTTPGISASGSTINITTADGTNFGLLTPTDYNRFANKVDIASATSGDVSGSYQDGFTVTGLGTKSLNINGILSGQVLSFNGTAFVPGTPSTSQLTSVTGINGIIVGGSGTLYSVDGSNLITVTTVFGGDLSGIYNNITVNRVQNVPFSLAGITNGQYLYYNGTSIVGFNVPSAIVPTLTGINGVTLNTNTGYDFTISGQTLATYSGDNLLTTLTGTFPNFTIAGITQSTQFTTLTGSNGLSVSGAGLSQTIVGQKFVGTNGIVVSSTGNTFTISNTIPGLSLFGDGTNTSVVGNNNNYTVLGIAANQTLNTISGISGIKIVTGTGFDFSIDGTNFITSIIGANGITVLQSGQFVSVAGANAIAATYSGDNLLTTLTGIFPNFTIAGITQSSQFTTLTGSNGLSIAGSGFLQTIIGQKFVGINGIVVSSTGNAFTISNTTPGLTLFGDGVGTSVVGSNNNYTVLGIGSGSQWMSSGSDKIYTNSFVGIGAANPANPLVVQSNIVSDVAFFESFDPLGSTIRVYNGGNDGARIQLESGSTFILENRVSVVGFNFSGNDFLTFNNVNSIVGINAIGGVVNIGRSGQSSNLSVTGTTYTKSLKINGLSNGILTVDGLGNVTTTSLSFSTTQTTLTGANGLSIAGSGFSQTIIGQNFIGTNGIVVSSTGNTITITNTAPGLSLSGDGTNTSVVGSNNNYTVLGIGSSSQWINTLSGVYYSSLVGIGIVPVSNSGLIVKAPTPFNNALTLKEASGIYNLFGVRDNTTGVEVSFYGASNTINSVISGDPGVPSYIINEFGIGTATPNEKLTIQGNTSISGIGYASGLKTSTLTLTGIGSGILTVDGFGNVTTTSLNITSSQWVSTTGGNIFYKGGIVGIGTSSPNPTSSLHIYNTTTMSRILLETAGPTLFTEFGMQSDNQLWSISLHGSGSSNPGQFFLYDNNTSNARLRVMPVTGNVVIGGNLTAANEKLTVEGNATILGVGFASGFSAARLTLTGIGSGILTVDGFGNVTTTSLNITSSQWVNTINGIYYNNNIGIGTINPITAIHISKSAGSILRMDDNLGGGAIAIGNSGTAGGVNLIEYTTGVQFKAATYNNVGLGVGGTDMVIQNGLIGIGTFTPNERLTIQGNTSISGIGYASGLKTSTLTLTGIGSGILTVDGFGIVTTTSLIFATTPTTLTGINGLSVVGSGFSQTIIGQNFIGTNGIVVSSTGNTFTISNTIPGLSLFGDGVNTSVVGANNNYTVLGIGASSQWVTTTGGIYYPAGVGINTLPLTIPSTAPLTIGTSSTWDIAFVPGGGGNATIHSVQDLILLSDNNLAFSTNTFERLRILSSGQVGIGTLTPNEDLTVQGNSSVSGIGYASGLSSITLTLTGIGSGILTVDGFGNVTTTSLSFATTSTTLTGINGLSVVGSGFSQTIIGQNFIGTNGIVISSTGNTFTINNTIPGLSLIGDGINTSVTGSNNNYTVLGIGSSNQWTNTTTGFNIGLEAISTFVGIGGTPAFANDINFYVNDPVNGGNILLDANPAGNPGLTFSTTNDAAIFTDGADNGKLKFASSSLITSYAQRVGGTRMTIDPISGNIGIGTTNPNERLAVLGNSSVTGIGYSSGIKTQTLTLTGIGSGILTVDGFGNVTTTSLPVFTQTTTTLTGINGISVITGTGYDFTIDGSAFVNKTTTGLKDVKGSFQNGFTVTGLAGAPINTAAILPGYALQFDGTSIIGSTFVNTIIGTGGLTVGTITGGYSIDGSNFTSGTISGTAGLSVVGSGLSKTVSGAGLVVLQQSMGSTMGSAATTFNTTSGTAMFKVPVKIPANVKTVSISLNAYGLVGSSSADYVVIIGNNASPVSVNSSNPDNIVSLPDLDVSASQGQIVMLKVYGKVSGTETAAYLQGITITVKD